MARGSKGAIEIDFGAKHLLLAVVIFGGAVAGAFLAGIEAGHRRAQRGQPSVLAFLEREADEHTGPVPIPDVLYQQDAQERAKAKAIESSLEAEAIERQKPTPVPPADGSAGQGQRAPAPAPRAAIVRGRFRIQVAALRDRGNADGLVGWLENNGYPAQLNEPGADGFLRVYVGPFANKDKAEAAKVRLEQEGFKPMMREF